MSSATTADVLPDLLQANLALVFCGTAASTRSAAEHAYYAHPGNQFWQALHATGFTPRRLMPAEYSQLAHFGIGLTDLAKHDSGNDNALPHDAFDVLALKNKIEVHAPCLLAFTSKSAARAVLGRAVNYGLQSENIRTTQLFVLPSPSGQARGHWDLKPWLTLAELWRVARADTCHK